MNNNFSEQFKDAILNKIKERQTKMTPRWHFILRTSLAALGGVILALALLYLISFIFFMLRATGVWFTPGFGGRGLMEMLLALPWLLIILALVFIIVLEILVRHYAFAYRRPLLYSATAIIGLVVVGGFCISISPLHGNLFRSAERDELPLAGPMYREFGRPKSPRVQPGRIIEITEQGFIMQGRRGEIFKVILTAQTKLPPAEELVIGEVIVVFGERQGDTIVALGIQDTPEFRPDFLPRNQP